MSKAGHNFPVSLPVFIGTMSADGAKPSVHFPKKSRLVAVKLMSGTAVDASDEDFFDLQLKLGSSVLASFNNKESEQGALVANVAKDFVLAEDPTYIPAGSDLTLNLDEDAGLAEISRIVCTDEDENTSLHEKFFILEDDQGSVAFWFDVGGGGSVPEHGADRAVEITTVTAQDDAATVAGLVATAINSDSKFSAAVSAVEGEEAEVIVTASTIGAKTDGDAGDSGFTVSVDTQGADASDITLTNAQVVLIYYPL